MTNVQIAWLAGLLEGEGCFRFTTANSPKIQLQMTDKDVVVRVARMLRLEVCPQETHISRFGKKTMWRLDIYGERAVEIMRAILPFMGERRSQKILWILMARKKRRSLCLKMGFGYGPTQETTGLAAAAQ